ncbi:kelch-like protein 9 [Anomaloglossus baeobatrachus]|uniref:kelch-like protein 9 n=1 Tax=Anomaloglossus baeobatrachus TaxID=238106 RepID=UPI003F4FE773
MYNGSVNSTFTSDHYPEKLLERMRLFRSQRDLCDVTLVVDGALFPAHKLVLAAASSYFQLLFTDPKVGDTVRLKEVSARGLQSVLDFIYSNKLHLSWDNVEDALKAAEVLLVREAVKLCFRFLEDGLNRDTCLDVLKIAKKLGPEELREKASGYVGHQYQHVPGHSGDLNLVDKATLCDILEREDIPGCSELDLFRVAVSWLQHDSARLKEAGDVLRRIRFPLIPLEDLQQCVKEAAIMKTDSGCFRYLQEALKYHSQVYAQPTLHCDGANIRSSSEKLLVLGGRTNDNRVLGSIWVQGDDDGSWSELGEMCSPVYNHCVALINDFLYIVGGQTRFDPSGKHPSNEVFRFDPRCGSWLQVAGMLERRTRFHTEVIGERIIAVGGGSLLGHLTPSAEEYHPAENKWEYTAPFPIPVADHAGTTHKGIMYISGGYSTNKTLNEVYSYLPRLKRWVVNRAMTFARCDHGMAAAGEKIFCVGGRTMNAAKEWIHVNETEYYCPAVDQWSALKLSPFDCCQFSITTHNSKLFITGGGSLRRMNKEDGVFVYDPESKAWKKTGSLPRPLVDHASCTIRLPNGLIEKEEKGEESPTVPNKKRSTLNLFITAKREQEL